MGPIDDNQTKGIMPIKAVRSSPPFLETVQFIDRAGKLNSFCAEVDSGSFRTIIDRKYLSTHLPDTPVDALKELPCTYDHTPIRALQGTVNVRACFAGHAISTTVFIAGPPCQPLIG